MHFFSLIFGGLQPGLKGGNYATFVMLAYWPVLFMSQWLYVQRAEMKYLAVAVVIAIVSAPRWVDWGFSIFSIT